MVPWVGIQFVLVVFPDHTHLLFQIKAIQIKENCKENQCKQNQSERISEKKQRLKNMDGIAKLNEKL